MGKIVAIGANVADVLVTLDNYPAEDTKMKAKSLVHAGGGPAATGLCAASVLGADCSFIGNYTDDSDGLYLLNDFKKYGVANDNLTLISGCRSFSSQIWLSEKDKTRTCVFDKGTIPPLVLSNSQKSAVANSDILLVDGNEILAAVEAATIAKANGVTILYDAGGLYDGVEQLLPLCDILIPSKEFALNITNENNVEIAIKTLYNKYMPKVVVVTCGKDGGVMFDGENMIYYPIYPANVVDSNGAGDVFHGAFCVALTKKYSYCDCCNYASAASALKCEKLGARSAVPSHEKVLELLKSNNYFIK